MTASTSLSDKFGGLDKSGQMDVGARIILQQRSVDNSLELTEDGNVLFVVAGLRLAEGERIGDATAFVFSMLDSWRAFLFAETKPSNSCLLLKWHVGSAMTFAALCCIAGPSHHVCLVYQCALGPKDKICQMC